MFLGQLLPEVSDLWLEYWKLNENLIINSIYLCVKRSFEVINLVRVWVINPNPEVFDLINFLVLELMKFLYEFVSIVFHSAHFMLNEVSLVDHEVELFKFLIEGVLEFPILVLECLVPAVGLP